jgi:surface carbohydrate biosynthesis protein
MRRIRFLHATQCDVLIFDIIGSSWLYHCLPSGCTKVTISLRNSLPIILSFRFFFDLLRNLAHGIRTQHGGVSYPVLCASVKQFSPKVIVSCADNNLLLARYAECHPQVRVVLIQNALRNTVSSFTPGQNLPVYLAFGEIEREIFRTVGISCRQYQPIGSVKLGLALVEEKDRPHQAFDLAFISHYRPNMFEHRPALLELLMEANQKYLFQLCCRYTQGRTLTLAVITKTRESPVQLAEQEYYKRLASGFPLHFVCADKAKRELDSYLAGLASGLVIHSASTLGFELLAAGKKAVDGATVNPEFVQTWGMEHYVDALPDCVKLKAGSNEMDFFQHCDALRAMPDAQYRELTRKAAQSLVSMPADGRPHEKVKALISDWLKP